MVGQLDDYEWRSHRNNVRILGVPEKSEGPSADIFVEELITKGLQPRGLSKFFGVERAHRIPGKPSAIGAPPRTIIVRIFNFRDQDVVLQAARVAPSVKYQNSTITFFPDFTLSVQRQRRSFLTLKKALRTHNIRYSMLFPAKVRVEAEGKTHFFTEPDDGWSWLESRDCDTSPTG